MPSSPDRRRKRPYHSPETTPPAARDSAALPSDILFAIFVDLGYREILRGADRACTSWRRVAAGEPVLWQRIDMTAMSMWSARGRAVLQITMERSAGQCEAFSGRSGDDASLRYLGERAPCLKSLRLIDFEETNVGRAIGILPVLEHLELSLILFNPYGFEKQLQSVCEACPRLKKLSLSLSGCCSSLFDLSYSKVIGIKNNGAIKYPIPTMHLLRSLQLINYDELTGKKLKAIIDNCPVLEYLHISHCTNDVMVELRARYARLKIRIADNHSMY